MMVSIELHSYIGMKAGAWIVITEQLWTVCLCVGVCIVLGNRESTGGLT